MKLDKKLFNYDKEKNLYTAEISSLNMGSCPGKIELGSIAFTFDSLDKDASGEDVMGWKYVEDNDGKPVLDRAKLLIIND